jgi:hypothetical protein
MCADDMDAKDTICSILIDDLYHSSGFIAHAGGGVRIVRELADFRSEPPVKRLLFGQSDLTDGRYGEDCAGKNVEVHLPLITLERVMRGDRSLVPSYRRMLMLSGGVAGRVNMRHADGLQIFIDFDSASLELDAGGLGLHGGHIGWTAGREQYRVGREFFGSTIYFSLDRFVRSDPVYFYLGFNGHPGFSRYRQ